MNLVFHEQKERNGYSLACENPLQAVCVYLGHILAIGMLDFKMQGGCFELDVGFQTVRDCFELDF